MQSAIFLDRDGVLNEPVTKQDGTERSPWRLEELRLMIDAPAAIRAAVAANFVPVIVTNQPDVAHGHLTQDASRSIRQAVLKALPGITGYYSCPHLSGDGCSCRKPEPGMLVAAARDLDLDLTTSWLIGDRWVDLAAARSVGVRSVLIERTNSWAPTSSGRPPPGLQPDLFAENVLLAVRSIVFGDPTEMVSNSR